MSDHMTNTQAAVPPDKPARVSAAVNPSLLQDLAGYSVVDRTDPGREQPAPTIAPRTALPFTDGSVTYWLQIKSNRLYRSTLYPVAGVPAGGQPVARSGDGLFIGSCGADSVIIFAARTMRLVREHPLPDGWDGATLLSFSSVSGGFDTVITKGNQTCHVVYLARSKGRGQRSVAVMQQQPAPTLALPTALPFTDGLSTYWLQVKSNLLYRSTVDPAAGGPTDGQPVVRSADGLFIGSCGADSVIIFAARTMRRVREHPLNEGWDGATLLSFNSIPGGFNAVITKGNRTFHVVGLARRTRRRLH